MTNAQAPRELRDDETTLVGTNVDIGEHVMSETSVNAILESEPVEDSMAPVTGIAKGILASLVVWLVIVAAFVLFS